MPCMSRVARSLHLPPDSRVSASRAADQRSSESMRTPSRSKTIASGTRGDPSVGAMRVLALADEPPHAPVPDLVAAARPDVVLLLGDLEPAWLEGLDAVGVPK